MHDEGDTIVYMEQTKSNPRTNQLRAGVTDENLAAAIDASGYPLQIRVAAILAATFDVAEEATYLDQLSGTPRALDIIATWRPIDSTPVFPGVDLLVECKQSELPYIFFRAVARPSLDTFPAIHGLREGLVDTNIGGRYKVRLPLSRLLGLDAEPFAKSAEICATFSKLVRKGKNFELSGSEAFSVIVLPLISALAYNAKQSALQGQQQIYFPTLAMPICVLDAPMVVVDALSGFRSLCPWIRVPRERADSVAGRLYDFIDVVHADFLDRYVADHLLPFVQTFADRCRPKFSMLHNMLAHVPELLDLDWRSVKGPDGN